MSCIICDTAASHTLLIQCSSCKTTICAQCKTAFYNYTTDYKCESCTHSQIKTICLLCSEQDKPAIIKPAIFNQENRWCHISCAMWYPNIEISQSITNMCAIPVECWNNTCSVCKKETCTCLVKCKAPDCKVYSHLQCTSKILKIKNSKPYFIFLCKEHTNYDNINSKLAQIPAPKPSEIKQKPMCEWCNQEIVKDYLICKKCQQIVHKACYGKGGEITGNSWTCQMCKGSGIGSCLMCGSNKGTLKEIEGGAHIHLYCAKAIGGFADKDKILAKCRAFLQGECCFCKRNKGFLIKCEACDKKLHHYCYFSYCVSHNIKQRNSFYCSRHIFFKISLKNDTKAKEKIYKEISSKRRRSVMEKTEEKKEDDEYNWDYFNSYFNGPAETLNCLTSTLDIKCLTDSSEQWLSKKYVDSADKSPSTNDYLNVVYRDSEQSNDKLLYFKVKKVEQREADLAQLPNYSITHINEKKATRPQVNKFIAHDLTLADAVSVPYSLYSEIESMSICSNRVRRCYENSNLKGKYDELVYDLLMRCEEIKMKHSEVKQIKKRLKKSIKSELEKLYVKNNISIENEYLQIQRKSQIRHNFIESIADTYSILLPDESTTITEYCHVCFHSESGRYNPMIYCNCCGLAMHQHCYGAKQADNFLCAKCKHNDSSKEKIECAICGGSTGLLKCMSKKWVHIQCILFSHNIRILDYDKMKGLDGMIPEFSDNECQVCRSNKGIVEKCFYCAISGAFCHMYCAFTSGYSMKSVDDGSLESFGVKFYFMCDCHSGPRDKDAIEKNRKQRSDNTEILNCSGN